MGWKYNDDNYDESRPAIKWNLLRQAYKSIRECNWGCGCGAAAAAAVGVGGEEVQ